MRVKVLLIICLLTKHFVFAQNTLIEKAKTFQYVDSSIIQAERLVLDAKKQNDTVQLIESYLFLSGKCNLLSLYSKSDEACKKALNLSIALKNNVLIGSSYSGFATLYNYKNDNITALNFYLKAKDFIEKGTDNKKKLKSLIDLAEFYRKLTEYKEAQTYINKGFAFYNKLSLMDTAQLIRLYNRQAAIKYEENQIDSSLHFSFIALKLCELYGDKNGMATSYNEIGAVYRNKLDLKKSSYYFIKARDIWLEIKNYRYALEAMLNIGILYDQHNLPKTVVAKNYNDIIDLVNKYHIDFPLSNVYGYLHKMYIREGDTAKAYINLMGIKNSDESYMFKKLNSELIDIKEKYENEKIKNEVEIVSKELMVQKKETLFVYVATTLLLILLIVIAYLLYTNIKKTKKLESQNKFKDVLIQEIHHRVKNNLQFINSLIDMQKNSLENPTEVYTLNDTSRRINSMSLVHEMLYNHDNIEGVDLEKYIQELVFSINAMVNTKTIPINFNVSIKDVIVSPNHATALGMITSELISNSIKYAFEKEKNPTITISLIKLNENREFQYSIKDNGIGWDKKGEQKNKLGMRLIDIFSRQLKGNFYFDNNNGFTYTIKFKL